MSRLIVKHRGRSRGLGRRTGGGVGLVCAGSCYEPRTESVGRGRGRGYSAVGRKGRVAFSHSMRGGRCDSSAWLLAPGSRVFGRWLADGCFRTRRCCRIDWVVGGGNTRVAPAPLAPGHGADQGAEKPPQTGQWSHRTFCRHHIVRMNSPIAFVTSGHTAFANCCCL